MQPETFHYQEDNGQINWNFTVQGSPPQKIDYMNIDESKRSLSDLMVDIDFQLNSVAEKCRKKHQPNERSVRKLCEKVLKHLQIKLSAFSNQIQEDKKIVKEYFKKQLTDEQAKQRITNKAKQYLMHTLSMLPADQVIDISKKYMSSYFFKETYKADEADHNLKPQPLDNKCIDDLYLTFMKNNFRPHSRELEVETENLIQIDLNLSIEDRFISDSFLWDASMVYEADIWNYTQYLVKDLLLEYEENVDKNTFQTLHEECRIQLKSQLQYKCLLKKYKQILVNFSSIEIATDFREFNIPVEIKIIDDKGELVYADSFEWDVLNDSNNIEQFSEILLRDQNIPRKYLSELSYQIRTQVYNELNWRFNSMTNTFRSILKQRENPKLNTQATSQIKKNIIYSMEIPLQLHPDGYIPDANVQFNNSEMFSLISRNVELIPEEFQQKIMFNEVKKEKEITKVNPQKVDAFVRKTNLKFQNNQYLPSQVFNYFQNSKLKQLYNNAMMRQLN